MNLRAMNMLYESIVKRGSLMVVPSGLADSLNVPRLMGLMGATGMVPGAESLAEGEGVKSEGIEPAPRQSASEADATTNRPSRRQGSPV
jgi:hypothetical protein